jgi:dipeptidyl aminopeptidase/acylaminoacyl peptidase
MKYFFLLIALAFTSPGSAQLQTPNPKHPTPHNKLQTVTPELLFRLGRVSEPQLSPDGKEALYNVRSFSLQLNKGNSDIWKVNLETGKETKLAGDSANETSAKWSADGKKIFFLSAKGGSSQLWSMNADGSNAMQESKLPYDINAYGISPSGNMIWYSTDVKVDKTVHDLNPDLPKTTGRIFDDLMYRHWDTWFDGTFSHVFIAKFNNGKIDGTKDIMAGERFDTPMKPHGGEEQVCWSADGKMLAYACKKLFGKEYAISTNSDIYVYDVEMNSTMNITHGMMGYDKDACFSPDGKKIIWKHQEQAGNEADQEQLYMYDMVTKEKKEVTKGFDNNVESFAFNKKGTSIYFLSGIRATYNLFRYDLSANAKNPITQITKDEADHNVFSLSTNAKGEDVIVTSRNTHAEPTEIFHIDLKTGASKQITFTNKETLSAIKMGKEEKRLIKATDGKEILTWIIYPPDFDPKKKYPTLLYCQGGPQSTVSQYFSYRWNFQLMAANGYIVVAPNRRGLPSFGKEWNAQISLDWGGQAMKDLLSAIDSMAKEPFVNKDKLGAVGASFGGFSVFYLAGHHNKRFKAFISHDGVFNFESMNMATEELFFPINEFGGMPWNTTRPDNYKNFSPHHFVKNWDTPILIITSEKDFRVPHEQGLEAFTAARVQNIPARLLTFPDENHWVLKPQNSVLWQRTFFGWLDKYLK